MASAAHLTASTVTRALEYGNVAGWLCVQGKGAVASLPTRRQIEEIWRREYAPPGRARPEGE